MTVLLAERDEGLLRLTLHRPEKRNALSPELVGALREAIARAAADADVRAVLLSGAGPAFCAGGDFDAMLARRGDALATFRAQQDLFGALARDLLALEKPVVAHVNGDAYGAGLALVLAADHAIAAPGARFAATFAKVGLVPDTGATWLLPKTLGLRAARELVLFPDPVDASRARELGIVNAVEEDHAGKALAAGRRLAQGPTRAYGLAKRALVLGTADDLDGALGREAALQGLCFTTHDHAEGVDAVREKRTPQYRGL